VNGVNVAHRVIQVSKVNGDYKVGRVIAVLEAKPAYVGRVVTKVRMVNVAQKGYKDRKAQSETKGQGDYRDRPDQHHLCL